MTKKFITVYGMTCDHCRSTISRAIEDLEGVEYTIVNLPERRVEVEYDETKLNLEKIKALICELGYDAI